MGLWDRRVWVFMGQTGLGLAQMGLCFLERAEDQAGDGRGAREQA